MGDLFCSDENNKKKKNSKNYFAVKPKTISDINNIFFQNQSPFFQNLENYFPKEGEEFLKIYPNLQKLALNYKNIIPFQIPLLKQCQKTGCNKLTRRQAAVLFLLSFFKLIPSDPLNRFFVFNILMSKSRTQIQFGRCFLNYLIIIGKWLENNDPILDEEIIFLRQNIDNKDYLENDNGGVDLCDVKIYERGSLFDSDAGYCVDFANKYIGGGVLRGGCVQEEILFAIDPEAIVSLYFMEVMDNNDAIGIFNTIQYSKYRGYGSSFEFESSAILDPNDTTNIKRHRIIAIDAVVNSYKFGLIDNNEHQKEINRDIHKAYIGFNLINYETEKQTEKTIATGNWGCGVFGGNHELKFIQQWISASYAGVKTLYYYTFEDKKMKNVINNLDNLKKKYKKAKELYEALLLNKIDGNNIINDLIAKNDN